MTQTGLIDRIIQAIGLDKNLTAVQAPSKTSTLPSDANGASFNEAYNYASVVGMLNYLAAITRPNLSFAVHQCARFMHKAKASHERAIKRIGRYLLGMRNKGLILNPTNHLKIDCYVNANFAGTWGAKDPNNPNCVKSRTGFVFMLAGCPCIWFSKLQTEIALSTMQAEYVALSTAMRHLLPFRRLVEEACAAVSVEANRLVTIGTTV